MKFYISLVTFFFWTLSAVAKPAVHCSDTDTVAAESVRYALLGTTMPFAKPGCFLKGDFKHFRPEKDEPEGEMTDWSGLVWYKEGRDHYSVESIKPDGANFNVKVMLTVKGKPVEAKFIYIPNAEYAKSTGNCGFVTNVNFVYRSDCVDKKMIPAEIQKQF
jgi:hypothetical protein